MSKICMMWWQSIVPNDFVLSCRISERMYHTNNGIQFSVHHITICLPMAENDTGWMISWKPFKRWQRNAAFPRDLHGSDRIREA